MSKTGHKELHVGGKPLPEQIRDTIIQESKLYGIEVPTNKQIGLVMSALRMHHIVAHAGSYDRSKTGKPEEITTFYPVESSVGRWLRDAGRELMEDE